MKYFQTHVIVFGIFECFGSHTYLIKTICVGRSTETNFYIEYIMYVYLSMRECARTFNKQSY